MKPTNGTIPNHRANRPRTDTLRIRATPIPHSNHTAQSGARQRRRLSTIFEITSPLPDGQPSKLRKDARGRFYLQAVGQEPKPVTIPAALQWYHKRHSSSTDAEGDIAPLAAAAAKVLMTATPDQIIRAGIELRESLKQAQQEKAKNATIQMTVTVSAFSYGMLAQAGVVNHCSPVKALEGYIESGDTLAEWGNDGFPVDSEEASCQP